MGMALLFGRKMGAGRYDKEIFLPLSSCRPAALRWNRAKQHPSILDVRRLFWRYREQFSKLMVWLEELAKPPQAHFPCGRQTAGAAYFVATNLFIALARIIHRRPVTRSQSCRNSANAVWREIHSVANHARRFATEVPAVQAFARSGLPD